MQSRIFIAINFSPQVKSKLLDWQRKWLELPVRWTKKENLHLTLVFIGNVHKQEIYEICSVAKEVAESFSPFTIKFTKICLGPPKKPDRMFWVCGERNQTLSLLKAKLQKQLLQSRDKGFSRQESRAFHPHITLGRIRRREWKRLHFLPKIDQKISLDVPVDSIEVMESKLKRGGAEYTVLESVPLAHY